MKTCLSKKQLEYESELREQQICLFKLSHDLVYHL